MVRVTHKRINSEQAVRMRDFETNCFTLKPWAVVGSEWVLGKAVSVCFVLGVPLVKTLAAFNTKPKHFNTALRIWLSTSLLVSPDSSQATLGLAH